MRESLLGDFSLFNTSVAPVVVVLVVPLVVVTLVVVVTQVVVVPLVSLGFVMCRT